MEKEEIEGRINDLNSRLDNIYDWINSLLRAKIEEYDKENDLQNDRLNKLEYELLNIRKNI